MSAPIFFKLIETPVGEMVIGATASGCCLLEFHHPERWDTVEKKIKAIYHAELVTGENQFIRQTEKELTEYFERRRKVFGVPLDVRGTDFELKVWEQLSKIRYGEVTSYSALAKAIGLPKSARAVGGANGKNRIAIVIPCHRVIGSQGHLTGYGGGMEKKRFLLELERGKGFL
jgi:AraC family transcriptional regulator of adaptative response/methylated-DNA-[protein]-cysteine methyltransferase